MKMNEPLNKMLEVRNKADEIFYNNNLSDSGFGKCHIFGSILKQYDIMLIGLNPGGSITDEVKSLEEEIVIFTNNPNQNDFLDSQYQNDVLISRIRKLYSNSFGKSDFEEKLQNTFWWNLCLSRNNTAFGDLDPELQKKVWKLYWELTLEVIKIVKPKIILTFVSSYNFIKEILEIENVDDFFRPNPDEANYYYRIKDVNFDQLKTNRLIGIPHLSNAYFDDHTWQRFGEEFRKDYLQAIN